MNRFSSIIFAIATSAAFVPSAQAVTLEEVKQHIKISGYIQTLYSWERADKGSESSSFRIRRARLSFSGNIVESERLGTADYRLQVDFAESPKIVDAWVRYRPLHQLGLQVGQFKIPLSIENSEYAPLKLEFIDYSLVVQRLVRMSSNDLLGISSAGRDCGAQLYGGFIRHEGFDIVSYNLAVLNGNGINQKRDNNKNKELVGRIMVTPFKGLLLAGYYQYGKGELDSEHIDYQRYGGGVAYNSKHAFARSEYIRGVTGSLLSEGAYISAGWKFNNAKAGGGTIGARFDYFGRDIHSRLHEFNYTLGAAYQPWRYMRLQLNYTLKQYRHTDTPLAHNISVMISGIF